MRERNIEEKTGDCLLSLIKKDKRLMQINQTIMQKAIEQSRQDKLLQDYTYFVDREDLEFDVNINKLLLGTNM